MITADTRNNVRWKERGLTPSLCTGDLAFHCDDKRVETSLVRWSSDLDNGYPRCTEQLGDPDFIEILQGVVEDFHIERSTCSAFVGTEEEVLEPDESKCIDNVTDDKDTYVVILIWTQKG